MTGDGQSEAPRGLVRSRPTTEKSYGIPSDTAGTCDWSFVADTMATSERYWVVTIRPDGMPHARPTWGVWVGDSFYCGGGTRTRWVRNLDADNRVVVHTESATSVVIIEGKTHRIDAGSGVDELIHALDTAYHEKYGTPHGTPFFKMVPEKVVAWSEYPTDATRWTSP